MDTLELTNHDEKTQQIGGGASIGILPDRRRYRSL